MKGNPMRCDVPALLCLVLGLVAGEDLMVYRVCVCVYVHISLHICI